MKAARFFGELFGCCPEILISSGIEDGNGVDKEVVVRAITGGTGRFRFVTGDEQALEADQFPVTHQTALRGAQK